MQKKLSNKELVAAGHKFAANISADTPLIDMAKMVSELATQLDVALTAAAEAGKQRDTLATENAALKGFFETGINASFEGCDFFGDHMQSRAMELGLVREEPYCKDQHENLVINACDFEDGDPVYFINETPATDAYLNAVRADGVDYVAEAIGAKCAELKFGSKDWKALKSVVFTLTSFAAQLRAGTAGKDGSHD